MYYTGFITHHSSFIIIIIITRLSFLVFLLAAQTAFCQNNINTAKPWAYWWWHGSAVDEKNITRNLEDYARAGFGGMHIIPIFGVKGQESRFIPFLSPHWVEILDYTVREGQRLGLGIDITLGTGWPYGGSHVSDADAARFFRIEQGKDTVPLSSARTQYQLTVLPTKQKVKRAAPGGEGWVLDHFNNAAVLRYLQPFDRIFTAQNIGVRAFYNDSYEAYGANWTNDFFEHFQAMRGYDLRLHIDVLARDTAATDREKRIWADYNETLSDLLLDGFTTTVNNFAHKHHKILRNEAHGAPANLLDLYAASDVPESEFFGNHPYSIPFYRTDPDYDPGYFGIPGTTVLKLASSAAHLSGKKLVSSETATWLGNHFKVSLQQIKPIIDESFTAGINHIFYHGVTYSPAAAPFPGWLFYASTNFNQQSHFWEQLPQLNGYVERCQQILQNTNPDNDILLYFPLSDKWHSVGKKDKTQVLDVHTILRDGFINKDFGEIVAHLQQKGYAFDYVSDRQLQKFGNATAPAGYKIVVVPPVTYMPLETLQALEKLQQAGMTVVFIRQLPATVNGYFEVEKRQAAFKKHLQTFSASENAPPAVYHTLAEALSRRGIRRETMRDRGLQFIRKKTATETVYFICNFDTLFRKGTLQLQTKGRAASIYDPLSQRKYAVKIKHSGPNSLQLPLALAPGESVFIHISDKKPAPKPPYDTPPSYTSAITLRGKWQVQFTEGQPFIPQSYTTDTLLSWTSAPDTVAQFFSGKARYSLHFTMPKSAVNQSGILDLGDVRESAAVTLNGQPLGIAWSLPMRVSVPKNVLKKDNILTIEVTNLSANRIRYIDRKGEPWKQFYDINIVDIRYRPFDATRWPLTESGLLGPVRLFMSDNK